MTAADSSQFTPAATPCRAPWLTLHLDPQGAVRACCENRNYTLGRVPTQSLDDIWNGSRVAALRQAVLERDFSLGCGGCEEGILTGNRTGVRAALYDDHKIGHGFAQRPVRLELELSNRCNLECVMCNGDFSSRIRLRREHRAPLPPVYDAAFFDQLRDLAPHLHHVAFLGGEPFLGPETLQAFDVLCQSDFDGTVHITTNGTVATKRVGRILKDLRADVSVSIDGISPSTVEAIRVGVRHDQLLRNVAWFRDQAVANGTRLGLHFCLMTANYHELYPFLEWADELDADAVIIPVHHPMSLSLAMDDPVVIERVLRLWADQERNKPPLGRNQPAWRNAVDQLVSVHREHEQRGPTTVYIRAPGEIRAEERLSIVTSIEEWADGGRLDKLTLDSDECVLALSPPADGVLGLRSADIVGQHARNLMDALEVVHGSFRRMVTDEAPPGWEQRWLEFGAAGRSVWFRVAQERPKAGGAAIWLIGRGSPPTAPRIRPAP